MVLPTFGEKPWLQRKSQCGSSPAYAVCRSRSHAVADPVKTLVPAVARKCILKRQPRHFDQRNLKRLAAGDPSAPLCCCNRQPRVIGSSRGGLLRRIIFAAYEHSAMRRGTLLCALAAALL